MRDPAPRLLRVLEEDAALAPLAHVLGADGLERARRATALVEGCGAVGAETARLLLASGLRRLVLVDLPHALGRVVTRDDLAANALLTEADVGVARVDALARRLAEALAADLGGGEALELPPQPAPGQGRPDEQGRAEEQGQRRDPPRPTGPPAP